MGEELLVGLAGILVLGVGAQWLSWRLRLPAILTLLLAGFLAGPISGLVLDKPLLNPDELFGEAFFPLVSAAVALILFEGGLSLKFSELRHIGRAVVLLLAIGIPVTWVLCAGAAHYLLGFDWPLAALLGAILIVTGPTVIGPLLRQVRLRGRLGALLKWEGILNDPIGAIFAVLVFEAIVTQLHQNIETATHTTLIGIVVTLFAGLIVGATGALLLILPLRRYWIPDWLQSPVTFVAVLGVFVAAEHLHAESGLLAVTFMGILLANQRWAAVQHIIAFKENLRVLLLSMLFVLLAARLQLDSLSNLHWGSIAFVAAVMFVVRPASVWLSSMGTGLNGRQRLLLSMVAPRGVVAAAVSSIFAIRLLALDYPAADQLVPTTFLVIICTITFAGLITAPLSRWLNLAATNPQGVLIMGGHRWALEIASALQGAGFEVQVVDINRENVRQAKLLGLSAKQGSILSDEVTESLDLSAVCRLLALTSNEEANALAAVHFSEILGRKEVYQLTPQRMETDGEKEDQSRHLQGRYLFGKDITFAELSKRFNRGDTIKATKLTETFDYEAFEAHYEGRALPLFLITEEDELQVFTATDPPRPQPGQRVISLIESK